jgi:uncharacterized protein (TIGR00297 family)
METGILLWQVVIGFVGAGLVGLLAWRAGALAPSGAWGATFVGGLIFGFGGFPWAALLLTFFISSSVLSKLFAKQKKGLAEEKFAKGSRRDWGQVLANGGAGAFLALVQALFPGQVWPWLAFAGAMATVNGDTWATELGVLSANLPRLITTGKPVERGTSGGISWTGTGATFAGAALVGLIMGWVSPRVSFWQGLLVIALAGLAGAFLDSLLGATVQAIYYDPDRQKETERKIMHEDGSPASPIRGWDWMNNDAVNFLSSIFGAVVAVGLYTLW